MGQACATSNRRIQKRKEQWSIPVRGPPDVESSPPPYADEWKRSSPSQSCDVGKRETEHDIELHPALRNLECAFETEARAPRIPKHKLDIQRPAPSHFRRREHFLENSPSTPTSPVPSLPIYTSSAIHAYSVPQWRWTNSQCRAWLTDVLISYGGKDTQTAKGLAGAFRGFGPNLYMKEWRQWNSWLGADGQAIFALLMEVHDYEGAVPKDIEIEHYRREGAGGAGRSGEAESENTGETRDEK